MSMMTAILALAGGLAARVNPGGRVNKSHFSQERTEIERLTRSLNEALDALALTTDRLGEAREQLMEARSENRMLERDRDALHAHFSMVSQDRAALHAQLAYGRAGFQSGSQNLGPEHTGLRIAQDPSFQHGLQMQQNAWAGYQALNPLSEAEISHIMCNCAPGRADALGQTASHNAQMACAAQAQLNAADLGGPFTMRPIGPSFSVPPGGAVDLTTGVVYPPGSLGYD